MLEKPFANRVLLGKLDYPRHHSDEWWFGIQTELECPSEKSEFTVDRRVADAFGATMHNVAVYCLGAYGPRLYFAKNWT